MLIWFTLLNDLNPVADRRMMFCVNISLTCLCVLSCQSTDCIRGGRWLFKTFFPAFHMCIYLHKWYIGRLGRSSPLNRCLNNNKNSLVRDLLISSSPSKYMFSNLSPSDVSGFSSSILSQLRSGHTSWSLLFELVWALSTSKHSVLINSASIEV